MRPCPHNWHLHAPLATHTSATNATPAAAQNATPPQGLTRVKVPKLAIDNIKVLVRKVAQHLQGGTATRQDNRQPGKQGGKSRLHASAQLAAGWVGCSHQRFGGLRMLPALAPTHARPPPRPHTHAHTLLMSSCSSTSRKEESTSPLQAHRQAGSRGSQDSGSVVAAVPLPRLPASAPHVPPPPPPPPLMPAAAVPAACCYMHTPPPPVVVVLLPPAAPPPAAACCAKGAHLRNSRQHIWPSPRRLLW